MASGSLAYPLMQDPLQSRSSTRDYSHSHDTVLETLLRVFKTTDL